MTAQYEKWPNSNGVWVQENSDALYIRKGESLISEHREQVVKTREEVTGVNGKYYSVCRKWLQCKVTIPEVEELPEFPEMVYAHGKTGIPEVWMYRELADLFRSCESSYLFQAWNLTVIPHPQNSPRLVKMIEEAQE